MKYKSPDEGSDKSGSFKDFPERLRMARKQMGETQRSFAKRFGVKGNTISRWENGNRQMPYDLIWLVLMELDMLKDTVDKTVNKKE